MTAAIVYVNAPDIPLPALADGERPQDGDRGILLVREHYPRPGTLWERVAEREPRVMPLRLRKGARYIGTVTGKRRGERFYHDVAFVASRDQYPEAFIRGRETPDQDRVFVQHPLGSVPSLYVTGSIRPEVAA